MYCSTRGTFQNLEFADTLYSGWISNKELYVPQFIPKLNEEVLLKWSKFSFKELSEEVFVLFKGDNVFPREVYKELITKSYEGWPENVVPLKIINRNVKIAELYHGPSHSFKDLSLCTIGNILNEFFKTKQKRCLNLTVTSGDTGSAVIECTKQKSNIDSFVFFPSGKKISEYQRLLMSTQGDKNIHNFDAYHPVDVFDHLVCELMVDLKERYPKLIVTSLNSILWIRIMLQVVHVFYVYYNSAVIYPQNLTIVLPGGGLGHTTACLIAKKLGLPININIGFNSKNKNTYNFLNGHPLVLHESVQTSITPAIDIQYPTNIERIIHIISDGSFEVVKAHMEEFYTNGLMTASKELHSLFQSHFKCFLVNDDDVIETMRQCYKEYDYIIDPHTAVGFHHFYSCNPSDPTSYMACASPIKFMDTLKQAEIPIPESYCQSMDSLKNKKEYVTHLPEDGKEWKSFLLSYIENLNLK